MRSGRFRQHGTDLQIPLNHPHVEYHDTLYDQTPGAPFSLYSGSPQVGNITTEEGYSRFNQDGLSSSFGLPLLPEVGVNQNEPQQMERAVLQVRARAISESMGRFVEPEYEEDVEVNENGDVAFSSPRPMRMGPCHFSPPTRAYGTMVAHYGNPSSRGQSSSHHSGRRSSHDQSSSGRGGANALAAAGEQFADFVGEEYEGDLSVSGYDIEDELVFQYEN